MRYEKTRAMRAVESVNCISVAEGENGVWKVVRRWGGGGGTGGEVQQEWTNKQNSIASSSHHRRSSGPSPCAREKKRNIFKIKFNAAKRAAAVHCT